MYLVEAKTFFTLHLSSKVMICQFSSFDFYPTFQSRTANAVASRYCLTTTSIFHHWPCQLRLMAVVVDHHLEALPETNMVAATPLGNGSISSTPILCSTKTTSLSKSKDRERGAIAWETVSTLLELFFNPRYLVTACITFETSRSLK